MKRASIGIVVALLAGATGCDSELFRTSHGGVDEANEALAAGKTDEALASYEEAAAEIPESPELSYDRGVALSAAGRHDEATQMLLRALETRDPELRFKVYAALGAAYAAWGMDIEHGKAAPEADTKAEPEGAADETAPQKPAELALPKWKRAVEHLEKALLVHPDDEDVLRNLEVALLRVDPPCERRDDELEPNDSPEAPAKIEVAAEAPPQQSGAPAEPPPGAGDVLRWKRQLTLCPDDNDWFSIALGEGDRLSVKLTVPPDLGKVRLSLLAPGGGKQLRPPEGSDVDLDVLDYTVGQGEAGDYLIFVENVDGDEISYGLDVAVRPPCEKTEDQFEENDDAEHAATLTPGPLDGLRICPLDEDWYGVTLAEGESLFMYVQLQPQGEGAEKDDEQAEGPPPLDLEVIGPDGVVHAGAPAGKARVATLLTPGAGRYLARVVGPPTLEARYQLIVNVVPPCPEGDDQFEDNDGPEDAPDLAQSAQGAPTAGGAPGQPVAPPQGAQGPPPPMLLRICPGDPDWFSVTSTPDKPTVVTAVFEHAKGDLAMELYDESGTGEPLVRSDRSTVETNGEAVELPKSDEATTYKLHIAGVAGQENFYLLKLDQPQGGSGEQDQDQKDQDQKDQDKQDQDKQDQDKQKPEDQKDQKDQKQPEPAQPNKEEPKQQRPLEDALDKLDRNPQNLEAQERALKSPLANHPPEKDW
ncbi:MAG: tetratricopeptide repeat protein [Deltaproteobacteria bacterium]|nr:tetratricopeptide repeat protein [Deltaproteobacteria bacterium]